MKSLRALSLKTLTAARTGLTLLVLTMSIFAVPPSGRQRPRYAIVRIVDRPVAGAFDPREIVRGSIVLTLPFDVTDQQTRSPNARFLAN